MEVKNETLTLCDLIRGFMEFAVEKGRLTFPSFCFGTRLWHKFLYTLKENHLTRFPELECVGRFDWDGPYPTVSDWSNVVLAITIGGICAPKTHSDRNYFYPDRKREINPLAATHLELLETMYRVACETKDFFVD